MPPDVQVGEAAPHIGPDALGGILPALPRWLTGVADVQSDRLPWTVPSMPSRKLPTMGEYVRLLTRSGICDAETVALPGALVMLPWGVSLSEHLANQVRAAYARVQLDEYAYPHVVAAQCFKPMADLLDLDRCLLHVSTALDGAKDRGILVPTGEQVIANHWQQMVREPKDLPIRMFQRARYFRPVSSAGRSGKGVFAALEAPDVFELHCGHQTSTDALNDLHRIARALGELFKHLPLPQFCGIRPPWGNHSQLYEWALGYDTPLPCGETVQTSALYFQGQTLSQRYDIGLGKAEHRQHLWQVDGFVSRRLLYAQLYLSINAFGAIAVHPQMAATQVVMLSRTENEQELSDLKDTCSQLQSLGIRPSLRNCQHGKALHQTLKQWRARGAPLILLFFGRREEADLPRVRLLRTDTGAELDLPSAIGGLTQQIVAALADVQRAAENRIFAHARACLTLANDEQQARQALLRRQGVISAVCPTREHAETVAGWKMGELCSFAAANQSAPCILCGKPTWARALLSRRI